ncbi:MAG: hypothetical protein QM648_05595 [Solirubrobacterales bacterium]
MTVPAASLYDVSLAIHQVAGLVLILVAVALTVISVLARKNEELIERGIPLTQLAGVAFIVVLITGAYQLIDAGTSFFQAWVIGALLLGIGFIGTMHGTWRPTAKKIASGELSGEALEKAKQTAVGVSAAMIVMVVVATYLMENNV